MKVKRLICMLVCTILIMPSIPIAAVDEIDYPHFMYRMEVSDFGEDFTTPGKTYQSTLILIPSSVSSAEDSYTLYKSETNDSVYIQSDGYAGGGEDSYETLINAVEAYFGADAAQFVRENFDYREYSTDGKMYEEIGDYTFSYIVGNNHRGYSVTIKREPIFLDLTDWDYSWHADAVIELYGEGIIKGMGDQLFAPNENITRAQFAVMFLRLIGVSEGEYKSAFADIPEGEWYTGAVEALADMGYIKGYDDGNFHPNGTISYQDMILTAYRYLTDNNMLPKENRQSINISDHITGFSDYAKIAIDELYARSLIDYSCLETASDQGIRIHVAVFLNNVRMYINNSIYWTKIEE